MNLDQFLVQLWVQIEANIISDRNGWIQVWTVILAFVTPFIAFYLRHILDLKKIKVGEKKKRERSLMLLVDDFKYNKGLIEKKGSVEYFNKKFTDGDWRFVMGKGLNPELGTPQIVLDFIEFYNLIFKLNQLIEKYITFKGQAGITKEIKKSVEREVENFYIDNKIKEKFYKLLKYFEKETNIKI